MQSTILIVDDSRMVREIYRQKLAQEKFRVLVATGGLEALQVLSQETPDLILLDLLMPDIDGFQILATLKRQQRLKDVPVMVFTSKSQGSDVQKALDLGAVDCIPKSTTPPNEVVRLVSKALDENRIARRSYRLGLDPSLYDAPMFAADLGLASFGCTACRAALHFILKASDDGWTAKLVCSVCSKPHGGKEAPARTLRLEERAPIAAPRQANPVAAPAA
jgi:CheY-like chemotaxis protein